MNANEYAAPVLGLQPLPTISFLGKKPAFLWRTRAYKLPYVAAFAGSRPAAWIDDHIGVAERRWVREREAPTLILKTDPLVGITRSIVDELICWAQGLAEQEAQTVPS